MEDAYIVTKIITAEPMDEQQFVVYLKNQPWESGRPTQPGYKVRYEDGYISWSPKETFERAYRKISVSERRILGI